MITYLHDCQKGKDTNFDKKVVLFTIRSIFLYVNDPL